MQMWKLRSRNIRKPEESHIAGEERISINTKPQAPASAGTRSPQPAQPANLLLGSGASLGGQPHCGRLWRFGAPVLDTSAPVSRPWAPPGLPD